MIHHFLRTATARERTRTADIRLGVTLAFVAGAVNAGGFLAVGRYTSHMTGIVSSIADALALHQLCDALYAVLFLAAFISGAMTTSVIVHVARARHYHSQFAIALMLEALLMLFFGISASGAIPAITLSIPLSSGLLCYLMGLQNALISKISHSEIRTTHMTGISTDIGIEIGRRLFKRCGHPEIPTHADRISIPARLLLAFLTGSIVGAFSFARVGFSAVIPFALLLILLAIAPIWKDLRHGHAPHPEV